jgi:PiT family inorganic phosphate transporter
MPCCRKTKKAIRLLEENHPKGKVAVAITLGLGTIVRWKRIVMMVGETIGKSYCIYQQGAAVEPVTRTTIGAADLFGSW